MVKVKLKDPSYVLDVVKAFETILFKGKIGKYII